MRVLMKCFGYERLEFHGQFVGYVRWNCLGKAYVVLESILYTPRATRIENLERIGVFYE